MGRLSLAWLGAPSVAHAGQPVAFPTRKTLALLITLSASAGPHTREQLSAGPHTREQLSALLWPESADEQGRASLRRSLAFLRQALGDTDANGHLLVERDAITLNPDADTELDLRRLQAASRAARQQPAGAPADAARLAEWQAAAKLVRGDFLEGFSLRDAPAFDDWAAEQREYWHRQAVALHESLSRLQSEAGEAAAAVETAARWVSLDPLDDGATARLMALQAANHDRAAALQAYDTYRARLAAELRAEPAPETQALAERLRAAQWPARRAARPQAAAPAAALETPWVGRAAEYGQLVEAYHQARAGRPQVIMLQGEAGIGKTRLASEFVAWAAAQGAAVLQGRAFETGGALPYQLVVEALRGAPGVLAGLRGRLTDTWLAELARLLPELRDLYPDLAQRPADDAAQAQLFEAVARLGETLARQSPLVLFMDDVQWADMASLDLLHYAGRRWREGAAPVLLLAGWRDEAAQAAPWPASLERDLPVRRLPLAALTPAETLQIVETLGGPGAASFGGWLFSETAGQPLFIVETLKALLDRGVLVAETGPGGAWHIDFGAAQGAAGPRSVLPAGVLEVIRARLARQTAAAQALLAAAAVLGRPASFDHLRQVAGMSEDEGLTALEALLAGHLLREAAGRDAYLFTHDKVRDATYAEAGSARQRVYHRRALQLLAAEGAPAAELAHHALRGGQAEPAFRYSLAAGDEALTLFAARDAIAQYEQALALLESAEPPTITGADLRHLLAQLGRAYDLNGELDRARQTYERLLAQARQAGDALTERLALNHLATLIAQAGGNFPAAQELLRQALAVAEANDDLPGLAETEWNLAQMGYYSWDRAHVLEHGQRALRLAQQAGLRELVARSHNVIGYGYWVVEQWDEAEQHARLSAQLYAEQGNRVMEVDSVCLQAEALIRLGQAPAAVDICRVAYATARELQNPWGQIGAACRLSIGLREMGQLEAALAVGAECLALSRGVPAAHWQIISLALLGGIHRDLQDLERALALHTEAQAIAQGPVSPAFKALPSAQLCADHALLGQWEQAYPFAAAALASPDVTLLHVGLLRWWATEALVRQGQVAAAQADVETFGAQVGRYPRYRLSLLRCQAVLAEARGDLEDATRLLGQAAALADELGLPPEARSIASALSRMRERPG